MAPSSRLAYVPPCVALATLLATGVLGVGRHGDLAADHRYYAVAAATWLEGRTPYALETFQQVGEDLGAGELLSYAYPPNSFGFGVLLRLGPSALLMTVLTLSALAAIVYWCVRQMTRAGFPLWERLMAAALVLGNPFSAHAVWTGNISIVVVAAVIWAWTLSKTDHWFGAGLLASVALMKPQLSLLVLLWFVLDRRWKLLLVAAVAALAAASVPIAMTGWTEPFLGWLGAVQQYSSEPISRYGFEYIIGIRSILAAAGVPCPDLLPLAVLATAALYWSRQRFPDLSDQACLGLLLGLSAVFIYAHDYDLVMLVPLLVSLWCQAKTRNQRLLLLAAIFALCIPARLLRALGTPSLLLHWRTLVLLLLMGATPRMFLARRTPSAAD